jgi:hypothetical protein
MQTDNGNQTRRDLSALDASDDDSLDVVPLSKKKGQDKRQDRQHSLCHGLLDFRYVAHDCVLYFVTII